MKKSTQDTQKKRLYYLRASFLLCPALLFFAYYLFVLFWGGAHTSIIWIWPAVAAVLAAAGAYILFFGGFPIRNIFCAVALTVAFVLVLSFLLFECFVLLHFADKAPDGVDHVIILGAAVKGDEPSRALIHRIDAAYQYLIHNPDTTAVLSGGKGSGENISEAECMRRELVSRGIEEDRLMLEDKSTTTSENIEYSLALIGDDWESIAVVTSNFHVFRALKLAKKATDGKVYGISASFDMPLVLHFAVREYFGYFNDYFEGEL